MLAATLSNSSAFASDLRLVIIGTDTSHVTEFTRLLNNPLDPEMYPVLWWLQYSSTASRTFRLAGTGWKDSARDSKTNGMYGSSARFPTCAHWSTEFCWRAWPVESTLGQFRQATACGKQVYLKIRLPPHLPTWARSPASRLLTRLRGSALRSCASARSRRCARQTLLEF